MLRQINRNAGRVHTLVAAGDHHSGYSDELRGAPSAVGVTVRPFNIQQSPGRTCPCVAIRVSPIYGRTRSHTLCRVSSKQTDKFTVDFVLIYAHLSQISNHWLTKHLVSKLWTFIERCCQIHQFLKIVIKLNLRTSRSCWII